VSLQPVHASLVATWRFNPLPVIGVRFMITKDLVVTKEKGCQDTTFFS